MKANTGLRPWRGLAAAAAALWATAAPAQPPWDPRGSLTTAEAGARFGHSLALSGEWLIVGMPGSDVLEPVPYEDAGGVMIYRRQPDGGFAPFTAEPLRSQPGPEAGAAFGFAVALWGERLVVGAPYHGPLGEGRVEFWEFDAAIQAWEFRVGYSYTHPTGLFGFSVAISRDRVAIGEPTYESDGMQANTGRVHSFVRNAADTFYIPDQVLLPIAPVANGNFGYAVAIADFLPLIGTAPDRLLVGEPHAGVGDAGLVWIYEMDAGDFAFAQLVAPAPGFDGSQFGRSLDISGAWNAIGARDASRVHLVRRESGGTWSLPAPLQPPASPLPPAGFGEALDLSGTRLLVGHPHQGIDAAASRAHLHTLDGDASGFEFQFSLSPPGLPVDVWDGFGAAVAMEGANAAIAAPEDTVAGASGAGRVAVYFAAGVFRDGFETMP